jgi:hypothetical protein
VQSLPPQIATRQPDRRARNVMASEEPADLKPDTAMKSSQNLLLTLPVSA